MKINQLTLDESLRYTIPERQLFKAVEEANSHLETFSGVSRQVSIARKLFREGGANYNWTIDYSTPVNATHPVLKCDLQTLKHVTGFPIDYCQMHVFPVGLNECKCQWDYGTRDRESLKGEKIFDIGLKVIGMPTKKQTLYLKGLADIVFLPQKRGEGSNTHYFTQRNKYGDGGGNNNYPDIILRKRFFGDFDAGAEEQVKAFYSSVLDFVVNENLTGGFVLTNIVPELRGMTLAQRVKKYDRTDINEAIKMSTPFMTYEYAPRFSVDVQQPLDTEHPEYHQTAHGWKKRFVENTVFLSYQSSSVSSRKLKKAHN